MKVIRSHCISRLHELAVTYVYNEGMEVITEDGERTLEAKPLTLVCSTPLSAPGISDRSCIRESMMEKYTENLLYGSASVFEYDYHERLFDYHGVNQIEYSIIEKLKEHPESRRAVAITWKPEVDPGQKDVPCLQFVQCHISRGRLDMTVMFRSNDILLAAGANMYALTRLQKSIAEKLNLPVGTYTHIAVIPHIYPDRDADELKKFIEGS